MAKKGKRYEVRVGLNFPGADGKERRLEPGDFLLEGELPAAALAEQLRQRFVVEEGSDGAPAPEN